MSQTNCKLGKFNLPLIRKILPQLIAEKLVGIQPMSQPASLIHYIKYKYSGCFILEPGFYAIIGSWYIDGDKHMILTLPSGNPSESICYIKAKSITDPGQDQKTQLETEAEDVYNKYRHNIQKTLNKITSMNYDEGWQISVEFEDGNICNYRQKILTSNQKVTLYDDLGNHAPIAFMANKMAAICLT